MPRNKPESPAKGRKSASSAARAESPRDIAGRGDDRSSLSKRTIWIATAAALLIVLAIGLAFLLVHGGGQARRPLGASVAEFVGSDTCAQCHPAEAKLWRSSQHKRAMD